jgi:predicted regulator of Ras-like GTPase activity (Roadblock/LC7/MglB family)
MDASKALADLTEISTQIEAAVIARRSGEVVATTIDDEARAGRFARAAEQLLSAAGQAGPGQGEPVQLEASLGDASVFVVREGDRLIAAATGPEPTVGLVFYDLKSALRSTAEVEAPAEEKPKPAAKKPEADEEKPKPPPRRKPAPKKAEASAGDEPKPKPRKKPAPKDEGDGAA